MSNERTVKNLSRLGEKVYVLLRDEETGRAFLRAAQSEGFTFGDGAKPAERHPSRVMALHGNGTVSYVGALGNMAFGAKAEGLLRVDFAEWLKGGDGFLL